MPSVLFIVRLIDLEFELSIQLLATLLVETHGQWKIVVFVIRAVWSLLSGGNAVAGSVRKVLVCCVTRPPRPLELVGDGRHESAGWVVVDEMEASSEPGSRFK